MAKDEVARMIRTGVTALFDTNKGDLTDEELDVLLGRKEGVVGGGEKGEEGGGEEEEAVAGFWREAAGASTELLEEVDVRHLEGVNYEKAKPQFDGPSTEGDAELVELGVRKRKQRLIMVDGRGSGYGNSVPVLAEEYLASKKEEEEGGNGEKEDTTSAGPKRLKREWEHEMKCFLCAEALHTENPKVSNFKCGYCPKVFHTDCLAEFNENEVEGGGGGGGGGPANIQVCPHHSCCGCRRTTAAAGGLLFRCVECPRSFCEDCLEDESIESLGRWKPLEELGYRTKQAYFIRCPTCLKGEEEEGEEEDDEEGATKDVEEDEEEEEEGGEGEEGEEEEEEDDEDIPKDIQEV